MELFDIIDENGNPTGKIVERSIAHAEGIPHRTAHIWIIRRRNEKTEILLQKRSRNKDSFPGKFDTSSAGHIQAGDEPMESALRELKEELGIHAESADLQFAGKFPISFAREFHGKIFRDEEIAFVYIYDHPVEIDHLTLQKEEVEEVQWFDLEETYQQCSQHRDKFCVPLGGLQLVRQFIKSNGNTIKELKIMRKDFGAKPYTYPQPVLMIATYGEDGKPDVMNAAWGGISDDKEISICVSENHKTTENILKKGAFTVSMADVDHMTACDYVGIVSGNKEPDKFVKAGFTAEKSEKVDAPIIKELPICIECKLKSYDKDTCRLIGEIVNVSVDESVLDENGNVDVAKAAPITFDPFNNAYIRLGEKVGDAFKAGTALK